MLNKINQELNEALQFEINNRFRTSSSSETIPNTNLSTPIKQQQLQDQLNVSNLIKQINNLIEQLNLIGIAHNQQIQFYRQHKYKVKLPHLLSEIYEIENGPTNNNQTNKSNDKQQQQQQQQPAQQHANCYMTNNYSTGPSDHIQMQSTENTNKFHLYNTSNNNGQLIDQNFQQQQQHAIQTIKGELTEPNCLNNNQYQIIHLNQNDFNRFSPNNYQHRGHQQIQIQQQQQQHINNQSNHQLLNHPKQQLMIIQTNQNS
jgi:hypothetical protein